MQPGKQFKHSVSPVSNLQTLTKSHQAGVSACAFVSCFVNPSLLCAVKSIKYFTAQLGPVGCRGLARVRKPSNWP